MRSFLVVVSLVVMASFASASIDDYLDKSYTLSVADTSNFADVLSEIGVGFLTRQGAKIATPTITLKKADKPGYYTLKTESTFKSYDTTFKPAEEFDDTTADGRDVKITVTFDGNKMIEIQKNKSDGKVLSVVREYTPEKVTAVMKAGNAVATRIYTVKSR